MTNQHILSFLATGIFATSPAWAVHLEDNLELDGDTAENVAGIDDDWDEVYADCQVDPVNCTPVATSALRQTHIDDSSVIDSTIFSGGLKDILPISDWTCEQGSASPPKSNILYAYGSTYVDENDDLIFYVGADRESVNGTANFGVWLFQNPVGCVSEGAVTAFVGTHLDGDLLLIPQFEQSGSVIAINVYKWTDPNGIPQDGDECVGNGIDCTDTNIATTFATGVKCGTGGGADVVCGITNPVPIDTAWRMGSGIPPVLLGDPPEFGILARGFYEGGVNLTQLIGESGCFATAMVETRTSTSLSAAIKDFVILDLPTCGTLEVVKETIGGNGNFGFSISPTAGGSDTFDLSTGGTLGGERQLFPTVEPGTYAISEDALPAGLAAPDGWNLTDMSCVGGTTGTETPTPSHDGGSIEITLGLNDDAVCTFTNTFTPSAGSITIENVCNSVEDGGQTFDLTLGGFGGSSTADCADSSVMLACGEAITCESLLAGDYTVDESMVPTGWELTDVTCTGSSTCGPGEAPDATISLGAGGAETALFTNTEDAGIIICKSTQPSGTGGDFVFSGDLGDFMLADGDCTDDDEAGPFVVTPETPYVVTEAPEVNFAVASINCTGINWTAAGGTGTITPDSGELVVCTFTNTQLGDGDSDGVPDDVDNCPAEPNPLQENFDGDTEGDVCDLDDDNDGQTDSDETACGSDPMNAASLSPDNDTDNLPDCVDPDDDNDGVDDGDDAFPFDPTESEDNDGDGTGDNADADDDNDGQTDSDETACGSDPLNASSTAPDADNDDVPDCVDTDDDNDGVNDGDDVCPDTNEEAPTSNRGLNKNRWALLNGNNFVQAPPQAGSVFSFTAADTRGCSCSQIVDAAGVGNNHLKRGCSTSVMLNWINNP